MPILRKRLDLIFTFGLSILPCLVPYMIIHSGHPDKHFPSFRVLSCSTGLLRFLPEFSPPRYPFCVPHTGLHLSSEAHQLTQLQSGAFPSPKIPRTGKRKGSPASSSQPEELAGPKA